MRPEAVESPSSGKLFFRAFPLKMFHIFPSLSNPTVEIFGFWLMPTLGQEDHLCEKPGGWNAKAHRPVSVFPLWHMINE